MKNFFQWTLLVLALALLCGCAMDKSLSTTTPNPPGRLLIWRADLRLEVKDVGQAAQQAVSIAETRGGYVEKQAYNQQNAYTNLTLRVPSPSFKEAVASLEALGKVTTKTISGEDVSEKTEDLEARLKERISFRNHLKALREKSTNVSDTLAIEQQLSAVDAEIASLQTNIKSGKGKVGFATIQVTLHREQILGPVGAVFRGIGWVFEKLFFIRQ